MAFYRGKEAPMDFEPHSPLSAQDSRRSTPWLSAYQALSQSSPQKHSDSSIAGDLIVPATSSRLAIDNVYDWNMRSQILKGSASSPGAAPTAKSVFSTLPKPSISERSVLQPSSRLAHSSETKDHPSGATSTLGFSLNPFATPQRDARDMPDKPTAAGPVSRTNHANIPLIIGGYLQLIVSLFIFALIAYFALQLVWAIQDDIQTKSSKQSHVNFQQREACADNFNKNGCIRPVPALEEQCREWEFCMNKDSEIERVQIAAEMVGEILNKLVEPLSLKTLVFLSTLFLGAMMMSSSAIGFFRSSKTQTPPPAQVVQPVHHHYIGSPLPPTPGYDPQHDGMPAVSDRGPRGGDLLPGLHHILLAAMDNARDWRYRGEGNANIVVAYGGSDPRYIGTALRIRKRQTKGAPVDENVLARFSPMVIERLFGRQYLGLWDVVDLEPGFLAELEGLVESSRPPTRRAKHGIDLSQQRAVLCDDLALPRRLTIPIKAIHDAAIEVVDDRPAILAIEIKPKCGFLPASKSIPAANPKLSECRFCMHQHWKAHQNPGWVRSRYCPLDLYSGNPAKIRLALEALVKCPQNNLRIFADGKPVDVSLESTQRTLCRFFRSDDGHRSLVQVLVDILHQDRLLGALRDFQAQLDSHDILGVYQIYSELRDTGSLDRSEPTLAQWERIVDDLAARQQSSCSANDAKERVAESASKADFDNDDSNCNDRDSLLQAQHRQIHEFLLATTLKDCSIMIALGWPQPDASPVSAATPTALRCPFEIKLVDMDPKSMRKMEHYYELDESITR
ncbi:inositol-pentakisphosphate 2-kinase-domain-containing protein [Polychytrium aggregatum]|uniref:inositol-pentakisphosphate 2-kinase-domain-containing protein n=1 Tax=Polychytrium aggregatum TaxID=110093 RepID=UPI0022FDB0A8|nr:inositol-pentakisphosphate 2-kinase-domain-containing protein [Polychytrium aggregatum]KAI9207388.1 inositol-pentakisphosphate 2-kinase-domain-containing protein [Polychytrium aggregatum]